MDAVERSSRAKYECLLFDLDDTLYPLSSGLNLACRKNIEEFMLQHLHIEESQVPSMCLDLYREYGTTMAGLKALGYEFDDDEFHANVHGRLPYEVLKPDLVLRNLLLSMPQRKIIFTNGDRAHATEVLRRLGLEDCFEGVICFETLNPPPQRANGTDVLDNNQVLQEGESQVTDTETLNPPPQHSNGTNVLDNNQVLQEEGESQVTDTENIESKSFSSKSPILCKPSVEAIEAAIRIANADPSKTIFFDDSTRNIASGKAAGLHTVIVGNSVLVAGADHALNSIHNIKEAIPQIWEGEGEQLEQVIQPSAVETIVLA